jgi:phosphatidylglycerophosphate synthase
MTEAQRRLGFWLAEPERRLLRAIAARLPPWVQPDHLTLLGVLGAACVAGAYALTTRHYAWLWAASAALVVQWFGDSLDGTLARVRQIERPRYGFYLDHTVDALSTVVVGLGFGMSPYVDFAVALAAVIVYLLLSINVYLETEAFGVFELAYSRIGPTELRLIIIAGNTALALLGADPTVFGAPIRTVANWTVGTSLGVMVLLLLRRGSKSLARLAQLEPPRRR